MRIVDQPNNLTTFICRHLYEKTRPIVYVVADDLDGTVSMLCGGDDCDVEDPANCLLVGIGHMRDNETALKELTELNSGIEAYLTKDKQWILTHRETGVNQ